MTWRVAKSLEQLRSQMNALYPKRSKASDGSIGDEHHASRASDHNPWVRDRSMGIVTAIDITHDPQGGVDIATLAEQLRTQRDSRIKYVIANGHIFSSHKLAWQWRPYTGTNPHRAHLHISVHSSKAHYDDAREWILTEENTDESQRQQIRVDDGSDCGDDSGPTPRT